MQGLRFIVVSSMVAAAMSGTAWADLVPAVSWVEPKKPVLRLEEVRMMERGKLALRVTADGSLIKADGKKIGRIGADGRLFDAKDKPTLAVDGKGWVVQFASERKTAIHTGQRIADGVITISRKVTPGQYATRTITVHKDGRVDGLNAGAAPVTFAPASTTNQRMLACLLLVLTAETNPLPAPPPPVPRKPAGSARGT